MIYLVVMSVTTDVATLCGQQGPLLYQANSSWFSEWVGLARVIQLGSALANEELARASILGSLDPGWKTKLAQMMVLQDIDSLPCET